MHITVVTLTYRRPLDLSQALPELVRHIETVAGAELLIVDNDTAPSARPIVEPWLADHPVRYVHEPRPGIAAARNRGLDESADSDVVVFNAFELLYVAKNVASSLAEAGYRPPIAARDIVACGDVGSATLKMMLVNMLEGRFISPYDFEIASRIADTLCGGVIERGSLVDEQWLLDLERKHFVELAQMQKTRDRIAHTMATGKPLRN